MNYVASPPPVVALVVHCKIKLGQVKQRFPNPQWIAVVKR